MKTEVVLKLSVLGTIPVPPNSLMKTEVVLKFPRVECDGPLLKV